MTLAPHSDGLENLLTNLRNRPEINPFQMGMDLGILAGSITAKMDQHTALLQAIVTGMHTMPQRMVLQLSAQPKRAPSWKAWTEAKTAAPLLLIVLLIVLRLLAPGVFGDVVKVAGQLL